MRSGAQLHRLARAVAGPLLPAWSLTQPPPPRLPPGAAGMPNTSLPASNNTAGMADPRGSPFSPGAPLAFQVRRRHWQAQTGVALPNSRAQGVCLWWCVWGGGS